jgi:hypothetical protein
MSLVALLRGQHARGSCLRPGRNCERVGRGVATIIRGGLLSSLSHQSSSALWTCDGAHRPPQRPHKPPQFARFPHPSMSTAPLPAPTTPLPTPIAPQHSPVTPQHSPVTPLPTPAPVKTNDGLLGPVVDACFTCDPPFQHKRVWISDPKTADPEDPRGRTLVLCFDGTGDSFDADVSPFFSFS